jgi:hypothetical protein
MKEKDDVGRLGLSVLAASFMAFLSSNDKHGWAGFIIGLLAFWVIDFVWQAWRKQ